MSNPPLYDIVNSLYHGVMGCMPRFLQERDLFCAFVLGAAGTYAVTKGIQSLSKRVLNRIMPKFDEKVFPVIEHVCAAFVGVAPFVYAAVDPEGAKEIMTQHPIYTSGMAGVYAGGVMAAVRDLSSRYQKKSLDDITK